MPTVLTMLGIVVANGISLAAIYAKLVSRIAVVETENKEHKEIKESIGAVYKRLDKVGEDVGLIKGRLLED